MYRIFRLTSDGFLKDINYTPFDSYLKAEKVMKELQKRSPKRLFKVIQF